MAHPYLSVQAEKESGLSDKLVGFAEKGITNVGGPVGAPRVCVCVFAVGRTMSLVMSMTLYVHTLHLLIL